MESTEEQVQEYTEADGTRVIKRTIIKRIKPSGSAGSGANLKSWSSGATPVKSSPAPSTLDVADPKSMSNFEVAFLNKHNEYRKLHGVPPLQLSRELCKYAQEWANTISAKNALQHRPNNKYGENIFWKSGSNTNITGDEPVTNWYSEIKDYDKSWYGNEPPRGAFSNTGHFTQVVWKASERVGVGLAIVGKSCYVVANYDPPGNLVGNYKPNVQPPKK